MKLTAKLRSRGAAFTHDLAMIPVAWLGAYWLRFNLESVPEPYLSQALAMLPVVIMVHVSVFLYFGLYRGVWRFASIPDLIRISKAVALAVVLSAVAIFLLTRMVDVPRSVIPLHALLLLALLTGPRFLYRWAKDRKIYYGAGKKALIVGAGQAGEMLARDLLRDADSEYQPVAFVDDNMRKRGREIHGLRVVGTIDDIPREVVKRDVDVILIAVPSATSKQMRRIVGICESCEIPTRTLPRMEDLVTGQVSIKEVRDVKIEDLLGRETVELDWTAIRQKLAGKSVLVTGGGGSIGSELCRQIAQLEPSRLIVLDRSEFNLYSIDLELERVFPDLERVNLLADVCDRRTVKSAIGQYRPDVIFHAAAYKHVPMLEQQVHAAVWNNVMGTWNVAALASESGCESCVLISTDKAVNPANIWGASKRAAEICCQYFHGQSDTRYITVRFGNVLGSAGSVIPLFQQQIATGGPVTVTDQNITRYFMTTAEAAQLILQANAIGQGGEIFVLDMGEPVKISYLARQLILLSGKRPDEDIEIVYTGLRPGEKLYEELFHRDEALVDTAHPKILLAHNRMVDRKVVERAIDNIEQADVGGGERHLQDILLTLVPEHAARAAGPGHISTPVHEFSAQK
ncbi:MAG: polysaccharide biosynthesis protein [Acidiferrobacterales bacterium]